MQFLLDKSQTSTLFEQAREQLLTALHMGKLGPGDRLPSVRQLALRNGINMKTAMSIYRRLNEEGYVDLRAGSGAYISDIEQVNFDQAYCLSVLRLIESNLSQASQFKLEPRHYAELVHNFVDRSQMNGAQIAVVECNEEQVNVFAYEISRRLNVGVFPVLLDQLEHPDQKSAKLLAKTDYFVTTDYHFKQVREIGGSYNKKILQVRLDPAFVTELVATARRNKVLMIVSNASFFESFRHRLIGIGISDTILDRIVAVDDKQPRQVRAAVQRADYVYISPIVDTRIRHLIPPKVKELKVESMLSRESIRALEAVMLVHAGNR
jgi:DNA-binding transcriptional regulator YhcF (GntR family)